jgi:hypothetical protein
MEESVAEAVLTDTEPEGSDCVAALKPLTR